MRLFAVTMRRAICITIYLLTSAATVNGARAALVFSALENGHWSVYWQAELGAAPELILKQPDSDQTYARFGDKVDTVAFENGRAETWTVSRTNQHQTWSAVGTFTNAVRPVWRPDAKTWLFVRFALTGDGEDSDLFAQKPSSQTAELFLKHTGNQDYPDISRDGSKLVYTSTQIVSVRRAAVSGFQQLWVVDLQKTETRLLFAGARENIDARWSPTGNAIAFASNAGEGFEIWTIRPNGTDLRQLTRGPGVKTRPVWLEDGNKLMFTVSVSGEYRLGMVGADGKDLGLYKPFGDRDIEVRDADWK